MDTECALTELPVTMCAHCLGHVLELPESHPRRVSAEADTGDGPTFLARYESTCPRCDDKIIVGFHWIYWSSDDGYVHRECP